MIRRRTRYSDRTLFITPSCLFDLISSKYRCFTTALRVEAPLQLASVQTVPPFRTQDQLHNFPLVQRRPAEFLFPAL